MKEKMPKKSGRWWFWRKRADSTIKQVCMLLVQVNKTKFEVVSAGSFCSLFMGSVLFSYRYFLNLANWEFYFSAYFVQSETKLETKEEPHSGEEGPSTSQEKLALTYVIPENQKLYYYYT